MIFQSDCNGLMPETSAFKLFMVANLHNQLSWLYFITPTDIQTDRLTDGQTDLFVDKWPKWWTNEYFDKNSKIICTLSIHKTPEIKEKLILYNIHFKKTKSVMFMSVWIN